MKSLPGFRTDVLKGMAVYDRICRTVLQQVAPAVLAECDATPASHRHSGILDAFSYFNAPDAEGSPDTYQNCGEHTDPGYFTISPRAAVKGLQLCVRPPLHEGDANAQSWIYAEDCSQPGELTIFCNEWLDKATAGRFPAMRHRVSRADGQLRLSMLYELRCHRECYLDELLKQQQQQQQQQQQVEGQINC